MKNSYLTKLILSSEQTKLLGSVFALIIFDGVNYKGYLRDKDGKELTQTFETELLKVPKIFPLLPIEAIKELKSLFTGLNKTGECKDPNEVFNILYRNIDTAYQRIKTKSY